MITTGMNLVRTAARILCSTQKPSIRGMLRSKSNQSRHLWGGSYGVRQVFDGLYPVAGEHDFVCDPFILQQEGLGQLCEVCVVVHKQNDFVRHGNGLRVGCIDPHCPRNACLLPCFVETTETKIVGTICNHCNTLALLAYELGLWALRVNFACTGFSAPLCQATLLEGACESSRRLLKTASQTRLLRHRSASLWDLPSAIFLR